MKVHIGNRQGLMTWCRRPVARLWWYEHPRSETDNQRVPLSDQEHLEELIRDTNCKGCQAVAKALLDDSL